MPNPITKVELQRLLGCISFFHRFLPKIAATLAPLHELTASVSTPKAQLQWSQEQSAAFSPEKLALASSVKLAHPDPSSHLALTTY